MFLSTHNICFYGELTKIILQLSPNTLLICSSATIKVSYTVMILSFRTDRAGQTVQTQIKLLIRVYTVCHSVCIVWTHYPKVEPHSSNFKVITTNVLGVQMFRKFTVVSYPKSSCTFPSLPIIMYVLFV